METNNALLEQSSVTVRVLAGGTLRTGDPIRCVPRA
jgi:MOSC domain-containing protein YiiM